MQRNKTMKTKSTSDTKTGHICLVPVSRKLTLFLPRLRLVSVSNNVLHAFHNLDTLSYVHDNAQLPHFAICCCRT